jgi:hypothetical protein
MQAVTGADAHLINAAHEHKALRAREVDSIRELRELAKSTATRFSRFADAVVESFANASGEDCRAGPNGPLFEDIEPPRDCRRLPLLRVRSHHDETERQYLFT